MTRKATRCRAGCDAISAGLSSTPTAAPNRAPCFVCSVLERLDDLWSLAEHGSNENGAAHLSAKAPDDVIEAQGILVSSIGLHAASRVDDVHLAAAYLQAFEALAFVRYLGTAGREGTRVARALTAEAPEGDHYRIAADIAERHRERRATAPSLRGAALDEAAGHERIGIDSLHDAAGPDFAPSSSKTARTSFRSEPAEGRSRRKRARDEGEREGGRGLRSRLEARIRHRPLPLRMRVDPVLGAGLAAATMVYGVVTATLVLLIGPGDSASWSARALPDRRLIENVRR